MQEELTDIENDLRSPVVPRTNHRAMVLIIKSCTSKVNEIDLRRQQNLPELRTPRSQGAARGNVPVVCEGLVHVVEQQNVLGLEVRVDQMEVVKERNRA
jgi:hypothetical protein